MPLIIAFIIGLAIAFIWDLAKNGGGLTVTILTSRGCWSGCAVVMGVVVIGIFVFGWWVGR